MKVAKYHDAVKHGDYGCELRALFGGEHTPMSCMLTISGLGCYTKHTESWKPVTKEMGGGVMRESLETLTPLLMMMAAMSAVLNDWNHRKPRPLSTQRPCTACLFLPRALALERGRCSKGKKDNSSLETCHDREAREMAGQRMVRKTKIPMAHSQWEATEVRVRTTRGTSLSHKESGEKSHAEMDAVGTTVKEKDKFTWNKML